VILTLSGAGIADGIALGRVHRLTRHELELPEYRIADDRVEAEVERLQHASRQAEAELGRIEDALGRQEHASGPELVQAHRLMVRDDMLLGETARRIRHDRINAEWALDQQAAELRRSFERIEDDYLALRVEDLDQVVRLLQRQLAAGDGADHSFGVEDQVPHQLDDTIVVAEAMGPAELSVLHQRKVAGIITEHGSVWSHAAIVARGLGIPMVVAVHNAARLLREDESAIIDSHYGVVIATRDERLLDHYREKLAAHRRNVRLIGRALAEPDFTRDGQRFRLYLNADRPEEFDRCGELGAAGIGLMRTEFVINQAALDDEQAQFEIYRDAIGRLRGRPLTIRTLDAGGDKLPDELDRLRGPNPALGLRGIRMSLAMQEYFRTQVRVILRASVAGPVRILLPMLVSLDEVRQARELIYGCRDELRAAGVRVDPELRIGGMIETPAAAWQAAAFAEALDFLSIGSNDLIQYLLAVDRQDELVSHLFDPSARVVVETLARIIEAARAAGRPVQLCGELAGDPRWSGVLLGLGLTELSLPVGRLAEVKASMLRCRAGACRTRVRRFLDDSSETSAAGMLDELSPTR